MPHPHVKTTTVPTHRDLKTLPLSTPNIRCDPNPFRFRYESGTIRYETSLSQCLPFQERAVTPKPKREREEKSSGGGVTPPPPSIPTAAPNPLPDLKVLDGFPASSLRLGLSPPAPGSFCPSHSARRRRPRAAAVRVRIRASFPALNCLLF